MIALEVTYPSTSRLQPIASSVPIGQRGLVHIWGRNDTSTTQQMGISWVVKDPDGMVVEEYSTWEMWPYTSPGSEHEFIGDRFDIDKEGTYTLKAELLMNPDSPVIVDSYEGALCTTTVEVPPEFELVRHVVYHWAYMYEGLTETCVFEFKFAPEQLEAIPGMEPFTDWLIDNLISSSVSRLKEEGARLIEIKLYRDVTPLLWTDYRCEITATASPLPWYGVVGIIAAIAAAVGVISWAIITVYETFFHPKPGFEEYKKTLSRESLIVVTNDFEEYLELPITPVEEFEAMSDEEIRNYCDSLGEKIVPPPAPSPWPWVILGAAGIAAGGLVLSRIAKKE